MSQLLHVNTRWDGPSQNVQSGVVVGVRPVPANDASEYGLRAAIGLLGVSTSVAALRGVARINCDQSPSSVCRFEGEEVQKLAPADIVYRPGKVSPSHPSDIQRLVGNQIVLLHEATGSLVVKVQALP